MTTTTAASDGGTTSPAVTPEPITGAARVKDSQVYHLASLAHDAAFEAERLCNAIYRAASGARFGDTEPGTAASAVADPAMAARADEAVQCLATAVLCLIDLYPAVTPS